MLTQSGAESLANETWEGVWSVREIEIPAGSVVRNIENGMIKYYGKPLVQQFMIRLHSNTGPIHFIGVLSDGTRIFK